MEQLFLPTALSVALEVIANPKAARERAQAEGGPINLLTRL